MSARTLDVTATRIAEHAASHELPLVDVVLHGGEPLLAGPALLAHAVRTIRAAADPETAVRFSVQTNGTLLDRRHLDLFAELDVHVSVSLDGGRADHDRHRRYPDGRSSHDRTVRALEMLGQGPYRAIFGGLLSTIDLRADPIVTYRELVRFDPPEIDFLLPHGNWETPPPGLAVASMQTPYAAWLIAVFDRWYGAPSRETGIRRFEEIINVLLGGQSLVEGIGLSPSAHTVVETDGSIEQSDMLTGAFEGAARTGARVETHSFDDVIELPDIQFHRRGLAALGDVCRRCPVRDVCGGGLLPHRYRADGTGFANASVYCRDLYAMIDHVACTLSRDLAALRRVRP